MMNGRIQGVYALLISLALTSASNAATYYLDADGGNDNNTGTSQSAAWKSLDKAGSHTFTAGDTLLLQRGDTFWGKLELKDDSGTSSSPVTIGAYGSGDRPFIGAYSRYCGIYIYNSSHISIRDIEIKANGGDAIDGMSNSKRYGVYIGGNSSNITIDNLYVHDIYPYEATESEGINPTTYMGNAFGLFGTSSAPLTDITVKNCQIDNVGFKAFDMKYVDSSKVVWNQMENIGGPAIVPNTCNDLIVRGNVVDGSGQYTDPRMHGRGSGIWPIWCEDVLIEKNTFMHARGKYDSCGAHIDMGNKNVVIQYNLSIDNEGGFVEILGGNENCAYRYNISINDGARIKGEDGALGDGHVIVFSGHYSGERTASQYSYVYNNTIYVKEGQHCSFGLEAPMGTVLVANNLFYIEGDALDGTPNWYKDYAAGAEDGVYWKNNVYQRADIFPTDWIFYETDPVIGDPELANPGGLTATDYIPAAGSLVTDRGITITKIPGDTVGLNVGLEVSTDYFGNPIEGAPDVGAIEVGTTSVPVGSTVIVSASGNGMNVWANGGTGGSSENWPLQAASTGTGDWVRYTVVDAGGGYIALKSSANGKYVCADKGLDSSHWPLAANRTEIGNWEKFIWINNSDGTFSLKSKGSGKYVCADRNLDANRWPLVANRTEIGSWEKFYWIDPALSLWVKN
ncbi:right-handed parallel beta-helix repeat-containing protein [Verrucomicrobia bacterium S94]|nr:right-handed parallel beta-helix repeat-containing protein [Verrucomicrobia bacterium S94]